MKNEQDDAKKAKENGEKLVKFPQMKTWCEILKEELASSKYRHRNSLYELKL